jgi:EF hand
MRIVNARAARNSAMPLIFPVLLALVLVAAGSPAPALGADPGEAFAITDRSSDGFIDRGEFYQRMVEVFFFADRDRDGRLVPAELPGVPLEIFKAADRNHDGALSLAEFTEAREVDFHQADRNGDGLLSRAEVEAVSGAGNQ